MPVFYTCSTLENLLNTEENLRTLFLILLKFLRDPNNNFKYPNKTKEVETWAAREAPTGFPTLHRVQSKFRTITELSHAVKFNHPVRGGL